MNSLAAETVLKQKAQIMSIRERPHISDLSTCLSILVLSWGSIDFRRANLLKISWPVMLQVVVGVILLLWQVSTPG